MRSTVASLVAIVAGVTLAAAAPPAPLWPSQWTSAFTETGFGLGTNNGTWFYDYTNKRQLITRANSRLNPICLTYSGLVKTQCNQLIVDGMRYVVYPDLDKCCTVCGDAAGCGIVKPNWMQVVNATYIGQKNFTVQGTTYATEGWNAVGDSSNLWYQDVETKAPVQLWQKPSDNQIFSPKSYFEGITDPSVFDLPPNCGSCRKVQDEAQAAISIERQAL